MRPGKAPVGGAQGVVQGEYLPRLEPTPGARALVERLHGEGLRLVVATSSSGDELGLLLRQAGVEDLLGAATSADDGDSKPDADIIEAALGKGKLRPGQALMIGDTPYDIEAAARAGVRTVALRCGGWWDDAALAAAVAIFDSPAALLRRCDEFPRLLESGAIGLA